MRPKFLTGDAVDIGWGQPMVRGLVIAVQQANQIPDAVIRGLSNLQQWHYWVLTSNEGISQIAGPLAQSDIFPCES
jgi:hypothetical protein